MDSETLSFGDWLRFQIDRRGWSLSDFARATNVSTGVASNWMNDKRLPEPRSCRVIAEALGLDERIVLMRAGHLTGADIPLDLDDPLVSFSAMNQDKLTAEQKRLLVEMGKQFIREEESKP